MKPFLNPFEAAALSLHKHDGAYARGEFPDLPGTDLWRAISRATDQLRRAFAWAVPSNEAIACLVECGPVLEVGAGTGYWAWCVQQAGGFILPTDAVPDVSNSFVSADHSWTSVRKETAKEALQVDWLWPGHERRGSAEATLFACWAPVGSYSYLAAAVKLYEGKRVVVVGEKAASGEDSGTGHFDTTGWHFVRQIRLFQFPHDIDNELAVWERD